MVIVWMKFKCERWFVVEPPLLRKHFLQFSSVIARVFYGARKYLASFFFSLSAAHYMDWTDFTDWRTAGIWQSGRTLIGFAVASRIETMHCNFQSASGNAAGRAKFQSLSRAASRFEYAVFRWSLPD